MNINPYLTTEEEEIFAHAKIGIAGCGGLGSNCLMHLTRSGLTNFVAVDFDVVSPSNLNRQFYFANQIGVKKVVALKENLLQINPKIILNAIDCQITNENILELFQDCQIIVEAFDNVESKELLIKNLVPLNKIVVAASGMANWGDSDKIKVKKIGTNLYVVGDFTSEVTSHNPPQSPRVGIVAAKQANTVISILLNKNI